MAVEVIHNPAITFLRIIVFGVGLTAIAYIAMVLWLDVQPKQIPVTLPEEE